MPALRRRAEPPPPPPPSTAVVAERSERGRNAFERFFFWVRDHFMSVMPLPPGREAEAEKSANAVVAIILLGVVMLALGLAGKALQAR